MGAAAEAEEMVTVGTAEAVAGLGTSKSL